MGTGLVKKELLLAKLCKKNAMPTLTTRGTLQTINVVMVWQETRCGWMR